ncbi:MAG: contractile injection system tape measure protein [Proteiniphilum sp.]|nr:contractile injection system tape measure protein [Proteiniphilum sp.]
MKVSPHIIEKVFVEVNTANMKTATAIRDNIAGLLEQRIFPKLAEMLDELNSEDRVIRFHTFDLNISIPGDDLLNRLEVALTGQLSQEIAAITGSLERGWGSDTVHTEMEIIPVEKNREELFFHFLEKGYLPWYASREEFEELLQSQHWKNHLGKPEFLSRLIRLLKSKTSIRDRFIFQIDDEHQKKFLQQLNPIAGKEVATLYGFFDKFSPVTHHIFYRFILDVSLGIEIDQLIFSSHQLIESLGDILRKQNDDQDRQFFTELTGLVQKSNHLSDQEKEKIKTVLSASVTEYEADITVLRGKDGLHKLPVKNEEKDVEKLSGTNKDTVELFPETGEEGIAVQNGGLILLHPFLKQFFRAIEILDEKERIKKSAYHVAIQALHYLATGNCDFFEGDLLFEKFLCGVSLAMPVERESLLSEHIKEECGQLLREVIRQWPALKNSSPDGLRQMFIQRNGKLRQEERNFKLLMERKAQDILLDKLSWNISLTKIPWRKELLFVEW